MKNKDLLKAAEETSFAFLADEPNLYEEDMSSNWKFDEANDYYARNPTPLRKNIKYLMMLQADHPHPTLAQCISELKDLEENNRLVSNTEE